MPVVRSRPELVLVRLLEAAAVAAQRRRRTVPRPDRARPVVILAQLSSPRSLPRSASTRPFPESSSFARSRPPLSPHGILCSLGPTPWSFSPDYSSPRSLRDPPGPGPSRGRPRLLARGRRHCRTVSRPARAHPVVVLARLLQLKVAAVIRLARVRPEVVLVCSIKAAVVAARYSALPGPIPSSSSFACPRPPPSSHSTPPGPGPSRGRRCLSTPARGRCLPCSSRHWPFPMSSSFA